MTRIAAVTLACVTAAAATLAQSLRSTNSPQLIDAEYDAAAQGESHTHSFTPMKERTLTGTVELVRENGLEGCEVCEACSDCSATHVLLRTGDSRVEVHLAPAWFLDRLECALTAGAVMTVTGARTRIRNERGIAAREVQIGHQVVTLRDEHGLPLWRRILTDARESARDAIGR